MNLAVETSATQEIKSVRKYERFKPQKKLEEGGELTSFQVQRRMKKLFAPCDKLSSHMFNYSADEYGEIIEYRDQCRCVEIDKKGKKVFTPYWLELIGGYVDMSPLNAFHRELLFTIMSAYEQGIRVITFSMALDALTGGEEKRNVYKEQYAAIKSAFDKLAFTRIEIDLAQLLKAFPRYKANLEPFCLVGT